MPLAKVNSKSLFYTLITSKSTTLSPLTLLFIHGLGSSSSFYAPIIPHLVSLGYTCLTLETHGSGCSPYTNSGNSIPSIAADALAVLDLLELKKNVVVVGHSMGGIVASYLAAQDAVKKGARFEAVVLIGPVNPNPGAAEAFSKRISVVEQDGLEPLAASIPRAATGSKSTPLMHGFIRSLILGTSPAGYISLCKAIAESPTPDYKSITIPQLIIAGAEDKSAPIEGVEVIMEGYASEKKELRILEGVGHWHVVEAYEEVQSFIGEFLKALGI